VPEVIRQVRKDMVAQGTCHPAFTGMAQVLQEHPNIYGEDEPEDFGRERDRQAEVVYFMGCVGQYREEEATEEVLELLDRLAVDFTLIEEVCCGGVLEDIGYSLDDKLVARNLELIRATGAKTVITGCPKCMLTFTRMPQYADPLRQAGIEVVHLSQFLARQDLDVQTDKLVTYHDPCDLGRHCGLYEEPRRTIKNIAPRFKEMAHNRQAADCCGAGGGVRGAYPANSIAMARRRLQAAEDIGAEVVLTECNSCVHNLSNAKLRKQKLEILSTAQFLNRLLEETS
jgi:Fe-S oxidoreductase